MEQGFVTDHFTEDQAAAEGFNDFPERKIRYPGHGGHNNRILQFYRADLHLAHPSCSLRHENSHKYYNYYFRPAQGYSCFFTAGPN